MDINSETLKIKLFYISGRPNNKMPFDGFQFIYIDGVAVALEGCWEDLISITLATSAMKNIQTEMKIT